MEHQFLVGDSDLKLLRQHLAEASRRLALLSDHTPAADPIARHIQKALSIVATIVSPGSPTQIPSFLDTVAISDFGTDEVTSKRRRSPTQPLRMLRTTVDKDDATIVDVMPDVSD